MQPTLILIGGPPRVGKSTIARAAGLEIGCWMSMDVIRGVVSPLIQGYDQTVGPGIPPFQEAELFFPHLARAAAGTFYLQGTHILEGIGFLPDHVARLDEWINRTAIFIGARTFDLDAALRAPGRNRWIERLDGANQRLVPRWIEEWSHEVETQCLTLGIPYIDPADDFEEAGRVAVNTLSSALHG